MMRRFAALVVPVLLASAAPAKQPDPPDVACGTLEWAPFRDAVKGYCAKADAKKVQDCDEVVEHFTRCTSTESGAARPIRGQDAAKAQFVYTITQNGDTGDILVHFQRKGKAAWAVTKIRFKKY